MLEKLREFFDGKKIVILGFGREGRSSYELIRKMLPEQKIWVADMREIKINDADVEVLSGEGYLEGLAQYDIIMKSPGISLKDVEISEFAEKIFSQLELLLRFFEGRTIGITGTKGKSTTSSLVAKILEEQNIECRLLGNIGVPVFERVEEINAGMTLVLEMSSHQLEFMRHSPEIAVVTNIFPEHLDHYQDFATYAEAKCNIYRYQDARGVVFYGADNSMLAEFLRQVPALGLRYGVGLKNGDVRKVGDFVEFDGEKVYDCQSERKLVGEYNLVNIMFAIGVAKVLGLDLARAAESVNNFQTLEHRLEFVAEREGVKYYDNAIGTVPEATIAAMRALGDVDTVIVGGMDRGLDYSGLCAFLREDAVKNVICMPETGRSIMEEVGEKGAFAETLEEAVEIARERTARGKSCLLSPAAASYGRFRDFREKGEEFQRLVRGI